MKSMTGRERLLCAINNGKPDRLPCQVHNWMGYYLNTRLGGVDAYAAYERLGMDPVIYLGPNYEYSPADQANWADKVEWGSANAEGRGAWHRRIATPEGDLLEHGEYTQMTGWCTKHLLETERDFEIWNKYCALPVRVDWTPVIEAKKRIGNTGIVRGWPFDFGQGSPWQSLCYMMGTEPAIMLAMDNPERMHYMLESIMAKKLRALEVGGKIENDLIETGGGAASNTVISPKMFEEFCLPYDTRQHKLLHELGTKVVYHLCGGLMKQLEMVAQSGADGLETMTPPSMGADCDLAEAKRRVGDKLFFVGGFDQNAGFEKGTPEVAARMVRELHAACPNGGYICSPSDHFFFGDPANIQAFADAAKECKYT